MLVTRPEIDAAAFSNLLELEGFQAVSCPLMVIRFRSDRPNLDDVARLAFTSANGVRAFSANCGDQRDLPIFAVGAATGTAARQYGFKNITEASGDLPNLIQVISSAHENHQWPGVVLHIAGANLKGNLISELNARGIPAKRQTLYDAAASDGLPKAAASEIIKASPSAPLIVAFFSPRTVELFIAQLSENGLLNSTPNLIPLCLSEDVAERLNDFTWKGVLVALERTSASMINALRNAEL